jgi:putative ABC transport system substrate-binding protein
MKTFLLALSLAVPLSASARRSVVVLQSDDLPAYTDPIEAFRHSIDAPIQVFNLRGDEAVAARVSRELKRDPPPLIIAMGAKAAYTATQEFPDVPLVYAMVDQPLRYGIEGPMVTGVEMELDPSLVVSEFKLFVPEVTRLGILLSIDNLSPAIDSAIAMAEQAGFEVSVERIVSSRELRPAFSRLRTEIDALWLLPDSQMLTPSAFHYLRAEAARSRLPVLVNSPDLVRAGALMCVGPSHDRVGEQIAEITSQILAGSLPSEIPIQRPDQPQVVLNRDTQDALGLKLDPVLLNFVDEIVREPSRR